MSSLTAGLHACAGRRGRAGPRAAPRGRARRVRGARRRRRHARARRRRPGRSRPALLAELPGARVEHAADGWEDDGAPSTGPSSRAGSGSGRRGRRRRNPARAVVIDPGRAFGTGAHPTTRLCVAFLAATGARGSLLDLGWARGSSRWRRSGSGSRPCSPSTSIPSRSRRRANARSNGLEVETAILDATTDPLSDSRRRGRQRPAPSDGDDLRRLDAHEAITSGYLAGERPGHDEWAHVEALELDGWAADRFRRSRSATIAL